MVDVRFGLNADIDVRSNDVRFVLKADIPPAAPLADTESQWPLVWLIFSSA